MQLSRQLDATQPVKMTCTQGSLRQLKRWRGVLHLRDMLHSENIPAARMVLQKHIGRLFMTPAMREGKPVFEVSGKVDFTPTGGKRCSGDGGQRGT